MSRTIRKNRYGKKEKEGQHTTYKCRCEYCLGKNIAADLESNRDFKEQMKDYLD